MGIEDCIDGVEIAPIDGCRNTIIQPLDTMPPSCRNEEPVTRTVFLRGVLPYSAYSNRFSSPSIIFSPLNVADLDLPITLRTRPKISLPSSGRSILISLWPESCTNVFGLESRCSGVYVGGMPISRFVS